MVIKKLPGLMIGWLMVISVWFLSLMPLSVPVDTLQGGDKLGHLLAYFGMTYWFLHLADNKKLVLVLFIAMGFVIELLQGLTGYRFFEWADLLANMAGVLMALIIFSVFKWRLKKLFYN